MSTTFVNIQTPESRIIKSGLVLWLQSNISSSHSGGSTWYDISGNGKTSSFVGTVPIVDGGFKTSGSQVTNYIVLPHEVFSSLSINKWTAEIVIKLGTTSGTTYFMSMANTSDSNLFIMEKAANIIRPWAASTSDTELTFTAGETLHLVMRKPVGGGNGMRLFKNGEIGPYYPGGGAVGKDQTTVEGWVMNQEQDSVLGGFSSSQATDMTTYEVRIYNRYLEPEEVANNFEAIRGRYGI